MDLRDRFKGAVLAHALGDAIGAPFEGWSTEQSDWKPFSPLQRFSQLKYTDDTEMSLICGASLIEHRGLVVDDLALRWARQADPKRGYGAGAIQTLELIRQGVHWSEASLRVFSGGSYGNGAAMRVAPLALFSYDNDNRLYETVANASRITHAHPLAIEGALIVARSIKAALLSNNAQELLDRVESIPVEDTYRSLRDMALRFIRRDVPDHREVVEVLGNGVQAKESVMTAVTIACCFIERPFEDLTGYTISLGGDVDTIGAMAGSIWGAFRGADALPERDLTRLENRNLIESQADNLFDLGN